MLRSTSNESRGGKFHPLSLFLLSALRASYGKLRFPESSHFGSRPFERIGFQPRRNTIAWLQFDHVQRFESTTDRLALKLYGEFNWEYGQIGLLCSLCLFLIESIPLSIMPCLSSGSNKSPSKGVSSQEFSGIQLCFCCSPRG